MKLFGGSGGHSGRTNRTQKQSAPRQAAGKTNQKPMPTAQRAPQSAPKPAAQKASLAAPKPAGKKGAKAKKQLTKGQKRRRIIIITVVVLALLLGAAAAAVAFIRPPQANNPTIKDKENGDKIDVNSMLNSGTRIDDVFTFVVGAVDEDETRTDALMVATMDVNKKTINIMNIPRDTMCNNGLSGASRKINAAYGMSKGIEQTKTEIERLMGFKPDKYVIVNFDGIAAIVDAIGGIDYEIPFRMEYDDPSQDLHIDLYAGMQHLDGKQTVEFLRWRHNNDYSVQYPNGDEGRVENQQKFLKTLAAEVFQLKNITKISSIADAVFQNVKTDLTAGELLWMGMQALQIKNESIQFFTLPGYGAMSYAGSDPYQYSFFFPYYQETLDLVNKYFNPYEEPITTLDMVSGPESGSSSSWSGGVSSGEDNYVWGDTSEEDYNDTSSDSSGGESSGGDTSTGDSTGGGDTSTGGNTGGGDVSTGEGTGGGDTSTGGSTGGGDTSTGGSTGGGDTSTGGSTGGGDTSTGGSTGGGDMSSGGSTGGESSGGGDTSTGGSTGGGESSGGTTDSGTGGGSTTIDPEA
nr:LCP family protein [uncultured Agathobaculum sp.]